MFVVLICRFLAVVYSVTVIVWKICSRKEAVWWKEAIMKELE